MTPERPSRFWERLGRQHVEDLNAHGFDNVKRRQALRYFTWRWSWSALAKSEQMRFLLQAVGFRAIAGCAMSRVDLSARAWSGTTWSVADRWLYAFAVKLLWRYASSHGARETIALPEPLLGNPLPVRLDGRLISQDLANSALELRAIERALGGRTPGSILEVGAGYGRTSYALLKAYPDATYVIVDIAPALEISRWYLTSIFPERRMAFLSPAEAADLRPGTIDLLVSISSLQEMTKAQVATYLRQFDLWAAGGVVYLKQWTAWFNPDDGIEMRFDDYPIPERWMEIYREPAPVQTRFTHAAWAVPMTS